MQIYCGLSRMLVARRWYGRKARVTCSDENHNVLTGEFKNRIIHRLHTVSEMRACDDQWPVVSCMMTLLDHLDRKSTTLPDRYVLIFVAIANI